MGRWRGLELVATRRTVPLLCDGEQYQRLGTSYDQLGLEVLTTVVATHGLHTSNLRSGRSSVSIG